MMYDYKMIITDVDGVSVEFTAQDEPDQYNAEQLGLEYGTLGEGEVVVNIEVIETNDPRGIIDTGNW